MGCPKTMGMQVPMHHNKIRQKNTTFHIFSLQLSSYILSLVWSVGNLTQFFYSAYIKYAYCCFVA